jgi:hypothetical protein
LESAEEIMMTMIAKLDRRETMSDLEVWDSFEDGLKAKNYVQSSVGFKQNQLSSRSSPRDSHQFD